MLYTIKTNVMRCLKILTRQSKAAKVFITLTAVFLFSVVYSYTSVNDDNPAYPRINGDHQTALESGEWNPGPPPDVHNRLKTATGVAGKNSNLALLTPRASKGGENTTVSSLFTSHRTGPYGANSNKSNKIRNEVHKSGTTAKSGRRPNGWCNNCNKWKALVVKDVPSEFCAERNGVPVELLIVVVGRPQDRERREVLRTIYAKDPDYGDRIRLIFSFGKEKILDEGRLLAEYDVHKDMLMFDVEVGYYGMSPLNFNTALWATQKCRNARFYVKVTDDVFLNIPGWLKTFEKFGSTQLHDVHFGSCNYGTDIPIRDPKHRFYASSEVYPFAKYPSYCAGGGLFFSLKTAEELLPQLSNLRYYTVFDDLNVGTTARLSGHCICNIPGAYLSYEITWQGDIIDTFGNKDPQTCKDFHQLRGPLLGVHLHGRPLASLLNLWKLKSCFADSFPRTLHCQRRYSCKQDNFHIEPGVE